eukprot:365427-Chlamydomonas_euryale.AAC.4
MVGVRWLVVWEGVLGAWWAWVEGVVHCHCCRLEDGQKGGGTGGRELVATWCVDGCSGWAGAGGEGRWVGGWLC